MKNHWYTLYKSDERAAAPGSRARTMAARLLTFALLALLLPLLSQAQANREISGKVTDGTGTGLPGVTVLVTGTAIGTSTGADGGFQLQVPTTATSLTVSFIGYAKQTVNIAGKATVTIALKDDSQALGDVVVVGYGTVKKSRPDRGRERAGTQGFQQGYLHLARPAACRAGPRACR